MESERTGVPPGSLMRRIRSVPENLRSVPTKNPELTLESRTVTPCGDTIFPRLLPMCRNGVTVRVPANRFALLMTNAVEPLYVHGDLEVSNMLTPMYNA